MSAPALDLVRRAVKRVGRPREVRAMVEGPATSGAFLGGLAMAAFGVALVSLPAALIAGGLTLACLAALYARSAG